MERVRLMFQESHTLQANLHSLIERLAQPEVRHNLLVHFQLPNVDTRILLIKTFRSLFRLAVYTHAWYCILNTWGKLILWTRLSRR